LHPANIIIALIPERKPVESSKELLRRSLRKTTARWRNLRAHTMRVFSDVWINTTERQNVWRSGTRRTTKTPTLTVRRCRRIQGTHVRRKNGSSEGRRTLL